MQGLFTCAPLFQKLFGIAAIDVVTWGRIFLFGAVLFVVVEIEKAVLCVSTHKTHLMEKMNLHNVADLVRYAVQHRLID